MILLCIWSAALALLPEHTMPSSPFMRMAFLFLGAKLCGVIVALFGIPDLLGMMFWGILYRNIGLADFEDYEAVESVLR